MTNVYPGLENLLPSTVSVERFNSTDMYGKETYFNAVEYPVRVRRKLKVFQNMSGFTTLATSVVTFGNVIPFDYRDLITLPDGRQPPIIAVEDAIDYLGNGFTRVYT